jgi:hypothetical protein
MDSELVVPSIRALPHMLKEPPADINWPDMRENAVRDDCLLHPLFVLPREAHLKIYFA